MRWLLMARLSKGTESGWPRFIHQKLSRSIACFAQPFSSSLTGLAVFNVLIQVENAAGESSRLFPDLSLALTDGATDVSIAIADTAFFYLCHNTALQEI
jgi:hypothetical protein